jgi:hypothetical protein
LYLHPHVFCTTGRSSFDPRQGKRIFPLASFPDRLWGPPSLLSNGYRGPFPGGKRGRGVTLTTHPHLMLTSWMSRSYTSSPPCASIGVLWDCFLSACFITTVTQRILIVFGKGICRAKRVDPVFPLLYTVLKGNVFLKSTEHFSTVGEISYEIARAWLDGVCVAAVRSWRATKTNDAATAPTDLFHSFLHRDAQTLRTRRVCCNTDLVKDLQDPLRA